MHGKLLSGPLTLLNPLNLMNPVNPVMIRLLALDIDGTLLDSDGQIPEANRVGHQRVPSTAGVEVVLATGRRYDFARPIFEALPGPLTLILSNGAVVKTRDGQTLMRHLLPRAVARDVLARRPRASRSAAVIFDRPREGQVVFEVDRLGASAAPSILRGESAVPERSDAARGLPDRGSRAGDVLRRLRRDAAAVRQSPGESARAPDDRRRAYSVALTEYEHRDFSLVDVVRAGCSKGSALREWAERRGVSRERRHGDRRQPERPRRCWSSRARRSLMGNAARRAEDRAAGPSPSTNDEAGVARAIETFVLAEAS